MVALSIAKMMPKMSPRVRLGGRDMRQASSSQNQLAKSMSRCRRHSHVLWSQSSRPSVNRTEGELSACGPEEESHLATPPPSENEQRAEYGSPKSYDGGRRHGHFMRSRLAEH